MNGKFEPYFLTNQNCPAFWLIDNLWLPLATGNLTDNRLALLEQVCASGIGGPPTHTHSSDEGFYVLEGHCTFQAGGKTVPAGAGTFILVPKETDHSFVVDEPGTRVLNFYTPAGFEMILMSIAAPALERKSPPPNAVPMPPAWIVEELSREYGQAKSLGLPFVDIPTPENSTTQPSKTNSIVPFAASRDQAPSFWLQGILWSILATKEQTGGSFSVIEQLCPMNSGASPHTHEQDEAFYLINGEVTFHAGHLLTKLSGGSFLYIPKNAAHSFKVESKEARLLNFYFPGGFEKVISTLGFPTDERTLPPADFKQGPKYSPEFMSALMDSVGFHQVAGPDFLQS